MSYRPKSRDNSPLDIHNRNNISYNSKINPLKVSKPKSIQKQNTVITTKVPTKGRLYTSQNSSISQKVNTSNKLSSNSVMNKSQERKATRESINNLSKPTLSSEKKRVVSKSPRDISNTSKDFKRPYTPDDSNSQNKRKVVNSKQPIKSNLYNKRNEYSNSLLKKYEEMRKSRKSTSNNFENLSKSHSRNTSKELNTKDVRAVSPIQNKAPKTQANERRVTAIVNEKRGYSPLGNHIANNNPIKTEASRDKSKEKLENRNNKFKKISNFTNYGKKIDFREHNTSPLLIRKAKQEKSQVNRSKSKNSSNNNSKKNMGKTSTNTSKTAKGTSLVKNLIDSKSKAEEKKIDFKNPLNETKTPPLENTPKATQNTEKSKSIENFSNKYIYKVYEISRIGYSGPNVKKFNQDNYFIFESFLDDPDSIYLSVCDGHGMYGHDVSKFLREVLPHAVNENWMKYNEKANIPSNRIFLQDSKQDRDRIIQETFIDVNDKLCVESGIDTKFSGSTCVSMIYTLDHLVCANVGDSRCTIGRLVDGGTIIKLDWVHKDLSRDHKPGDSDEKERIIKNNGRIEPYTDENEEFTGPDRVWLKDEDLPGLAMSRSFGDEVAASVGVIPVPEIFDWKLTKEDKFVILASDGLWEFIESGEVKLLILVC